MFRCDGGAGISGILVALVAMASGARAQGTTATVDLARLAESYRLLAQSHAVRDRNPGLALLLGIEGHRLVATRPAREAVSRALMATHEERTLFVSPNGANSVAFDPAGRRVVTTSNDGWAAIWEIASGRLLAERVSIASNLGRVTATETASFSPDGARVLLTLTRGPARIWVPSARGEAAIAALDHEKGAEPTRDRVASFATRATRIVTGVRLNNGGGQVDSVGHVFDATSGEVLSRFLGREPRLCRAETHFVTFDPPEKTVRIYRIDVPEPPVEILIEERPTGARLSADGDLVFVNAKRAIRVFDVESGAPLHRFEHADYIWHYEVSERDGKGALAVVGRASPVDVFDLESRSRIGTVDFGGSIAQRLAFSPDGSMLACGTTDGRIEIVRVADCSPLLSLRGHELAVTSLCFDAAGERLASTSEDGTARIWRVAGTRAVTRLVDFERGSTGKTAIAPNPGLMSYAGSYRGGIPIWDLNTGEKIAHLEADHPTAPTFIAGGEQLLLRDTRSTRLWQHAHPTPMRKIAEQTKHDQFALRTDGKCYALATDDMMRLVALDPGSTRGTELQETATGIAFSRDGEHLFAANYDRPRQLSCFDVASGQPVWRSAIPVGASRGGMIVAAIASSHARVAVTIGPEPEIHVFDRRSGALEATLTAHGAKNVTDLQFSPDENRLVSVGGDWTVRLWDVKTWENLATTRRTRSWSYETWWKHAMVSFSPDGLWYALCFQQERVVQVRSCRDGSLAWECRDARECVQALEFDSASQYLLVATRSGLVYRYPAIPILRGQRARPRDFLPHEYASHVVADDDPVRTKSALAYRLCYHQEHELAPLHELQMLWEALSRADLESAQYKAALVIAKRLVQRQPTSRRAAIAYGVAHYRVGDAKSALRLLDAVTSVPAAAALGAGIPLPGAVTRPPADDLIVRTVRALSQAALGNTLPARESLPALRGAADDPTLVDAGLVRSFVDELERVVE